MGRVLFVLAIAVFTAQCSLIENKVADNRRVKRSSCVDCDSGQLPAPGPPRPRPPYDRRLYSRYFDYPSPRSYPLPPRSPPIYFPYPPPTPPWHKIINNSDEEDKSDQDYDDRVDAVAGVTGQNSGHAFSLASVETNDGNLKYQGRYGTQSPISQSDNRQNGQSSVNYETQKSVDSGFGTNSEILSSSNPQASANIQSGNDHVSLTGTSAQSSATSNAQSSLDHINQFTTGTSVQKLVTDGVSSRKLNTGSSGMGSSQSINSLSSGNQQSSDFDGNLPSENSDILSSASGTKFSGKSGSSSTRGSVDSSAISNAHAFSDFTGVDNKSNYDDRVDAVAGVTGQNSGHAFSLASVGTNYGNSKYQGRYGTQSPISQSDNRQNGQSSVNYETQKSVDSGFGTNSAILSSSNPQASANIQSGNDHVSPTGTSAQSSATSNAQSSLDHINQFTTGTSVQKLVTDGVSSRKLNTGSSGIGSSQSINSLSSGNQQSSDYDGNLPSENSEILSSASGTKFSGKSDSSSTRGSVDSSAISNAHAFSDFTGADNKSNSRGHFGSQRPTGNANYNSFGFQSAGRNTPSSSFNKLIQDSNVHSFSIGDQTCVCGPRESVLFNVISKSRLTNTFDGQVSQQSSSESNAQSSTGDNSQLRNIVGNQSPSDQTNYKGSQYSFKTGDGNIVGYDLQFNGPKISPRTENEQSGDSSNGASSLDSGSNTDDFVSKHDVSAISQPGSAPPSGVLLPPFGPTSTQKSRLYNNGAFGKRYFSAESDNPRNVNQGPQEFESQRYEHQRDGNPEPFTDQQQISKIGSSGSDGTYLTFSSSRVNGFGDHESINGGSGYSKDFGPGRLETSQSPQTPDQNGCTNCGKKYALSNAQSKDQDAFAVSVGI